MRYVVTILLPADPMIEAVRKQNRVDQYEPHVTLVYPCEIHDTQGLDAHVREVAKNQSPFTIALRGYGSSAKDYLLYLLVESGKEHVMQLHYDLHADLLAECSNDDMPTYVPHVTLGRFESRQELDKARKDLPEIEFTADVKAIQLLSLDDNGKLVERKDYPLQG